MPMIHNNFLQQLFAIGRRVLSESDVNRILTIALDEVIEISNAERGLIILFDDNVQPLFQTYRNLNKESLENPEFEISQTIINGVKNSGDSICLDNAMSNRKLEKSRSTARLKLLSVLCLPLCHDNNIFGVVYLDNRIKEAAFTPDLCQFAESFSDFISLAAHTALREKKLLNHFSLLENELRNKYGFDAIIGHHPEMVAIFKRFPEWQIRTRQFSSRARAEQEKN
ncbi:GAF domain-containing protein [candidate division KSB1 bacterium]|nr:GAF domain-containing protein [candidate division KSB1 bacterium]